MDAQLDKANDIFIYIGIPLNADANDLCNHVMQNVSYLYEK